MGSEGTSRRGRRSAFRGGDTPSARRSDLWGTPRDLLPPEVLEGLDLDAAGDPDRHLVSPWLGPGSPLGEEDALAVRWSDYGQRIWLNPPYSRVLPFMDRAQEAAEDGAQVLALVFARTSTRWWWRHVLARDQDTGEPTGRSPASRVYVASRRIRFLSPEEPSRPSGAAGAPSALVVWQGAEAPDQVPGLHPLPVLR